MKPLLVLIVATASLLAQSTEKYRSALIRGTVIDQDGSPVSFATVYAVPQGLVLDDVIPRSVKTDSTGRFEFHEMLDFGSYKLYSRKDADGYLNPLDAFYADGTNEPVQVAVTPKHPTSTVTVKLGKQAAVISGKIFDVDSGTPLMAYVGLMDDEGNGHSMVVDGDYNLLVPSEKYVTVMVTVIGTRRPLIPVSSLRLEPGQHIYMDIPITAPEK
ncbi:MAG TPA: carboxypeptidase-like regulatory domain-containing protein [Candidatus Sulfotelmatobacter sp.]|nr:carboxypeptidase-like regulatory domain-containing protein [Candidatus Sulfotelmatobacter sp.]